MKRVKGPTAWVVLAMVVSGAWCGQAPGGERGGEAVARAITSEPVAKDTAAKVEAGPSASPLDGALVEYAFEPSTPADEALIFTPPGFDKVGVPSRASGPDAGHLKLVVADATTGKLTPCRVNVVGPDGNFYEPKEGHLKPYSLTGQWPKDKAWGNRVDKAPIRYFGRFFYCTGEAAVDVPAGAVRVEVWKGFEYRPESITLEVGKGETRAVEVALNHAVPMRPAGYESGDPHIHIPRAGDEDERTILDLMEAEDIRYATDLAYNEPAGPYSGFMEKLASPQSRGLGKGSILTRGDYQIISGQEYRSSTYGHMNLFLLDELVMRGQSLDADRWPLFGDVARKVRESGGVAFHAHGGYAQEVYADVVQGNIDAIELLQFGVYRGIGLTDWYRLLNSGFRIPIVGACDYPACRKLGDCITYVRADARDGIEGWLRGAVAGRSFATTGPLVLLEVEGQEPGAIIEKGGLGPHRVKARVRVRSEVAPVTNVQIVVNGRVLEERLVPEGDRLGRWIELERQVVLDRPAWIAARAFSSSRLGTPDAEAHTNPVYVYIGGKAPYEQSALDVIVQRLDGQIAAHKARKFPDQARVVAYFEKSRDILLKVREARGASAEGHPSDLLGEPTALKDPGLRTHSDEELREFLKPVPPKPIEEVLRTFETVDGFRMELVAREPLVYNPIASAFDEDGNLYVAEMRDYPYKPRPGKEPIGGVRLLIDKDGDGRFDEGHLFADHLLWAGGIAPWKGGVFVAAPPDIWYLKDTDGDHEADVRRRVFTGFGTQNQQAMLNNLVWGLDHKIYGSTAGNGGAIRPADRPESPPIDVHGRDFRFDPATAEFEAITGTVQFGNTFDDWGDRFLCSESQPLLHAVLPQHYLARNPYLAVPGAIWNIAPGPVPIFRISPIERWRQIRSSRRIAHNARQATDAGASHHVVDAAAGVTIYRGGAYPSKYHGNAFVGDAQNNLVHRRVLVPDGVTFTSRRADEGTEFVRSPDPWFRPVNLVNAPDGTLYVLDMSREILESIHIPNDVVKHLDLTSGRDRGRIYRIAPPGFRYPGPPRLGKASTPELVAALEGPHGWWRDTALRLLRERQDPSALAPLRQLLAEGARPQARLLALCSLHGQGALGDEDLLRALSDASSHVRAHAIRLSEGRLDESPKILEKVLALAPASDDPRLQFQLAFSLGETTSGRGAEALARIARASAGDPWIRTAVLSSSAEFADELLVTLLDDRAFLDTPAGPEFVQSLSEVAGARRRPEELGRVFEALASSPTVAGNGPLRLRLVLAVGEALKRSGGRLDAAIQCPDSARSLLRSLEAQARRIAGDPAARPEERRDAIRLLSCMSFPKVIDTLKSLLDVRQPEPILVLALQALAGYPDAEVAAIVLTRWAEYTPEVRKEAIETLLSRDDRALAFLHALEEGKASASSLDEARRSGLRTHRDETIRALAKRLLGADTSSSRQQVVATYLPALKLSGDARRGETVFRRDCSACHKIGDTGHAIGPDLTSSASRDAEALLVHILDPCGYVLPNFVQYHVADKEGRIYTGLIASQSATSITLRREEGKTETILRTNVDQLVSSGKSLMPEGFETKLTLPEMADLISFLQASQPVRPADQPLDIGTEPGPTEPDK